MKPSLLIAIPTKDRFNKIDKLLSDIYSSRRFCSDKYEVNIHVYVDTLLDLQNLYTYTNAVFYKGNAKVLQFQYNAPKLWNFILKDMKEDALMYLTDDCTMEEGCIKNAMDKIVEKDFDAVLGLNVTNCLEGHGCRASHGVIGRKFADRFADRKVFCTDYNCLYIDEELLNYSKSIDKFEFLEEAKIEHLHPSFTKEKPDDTHNWHRRNKQKDVATYKLRKEKGYLWGKNFNLINGE